MGMYFSPGFVDSAPGRNGTSGGFFDSDIHGDAVPADAVPLTPARYQELLAAQADGKELYVGKGGVPKFRTRAISAAQIRGEMTAVIRSEAAARINAVSPLWQQLNDTRNPTDAGAIRFARIDAVRDASNRIEAQIADLPAAELSAIDIPNHPLWPEFD